MKLENEARPDETVSTPIAGRSMSLARAVIIAGVIVALGTFFTNTLHDVKENNEQNELRAHATDCRHWEEKARAVAYSQAEFYRQRLGVSSPDKRTNAEYWVALDKVQKWYLISATDASAGKIDRPAYC